ncbi:hypothetical protein Drose_25720 [Dactylosporangium roseum]|uniref:Uncharacterized protein n=1 Tax=Dactylosporangium roseum TaxID=47989 RepID=A0ABY5YYL4_9ACTN|nr:hypothetical protein [Dactylosporangium roseum]UWZ34607.1 hypothetical protein Drose_25720 [Dactylosporangium roseum]
MTALVPVGLYLGAFPDGRGHWTRLGALVHEVRRGAEVEVLTGEEYTAWLLAHDTDTERVGSDGLATARERLIERGLLVESPRGDTAVTVFARTYRIMPLLLGLGPSGSVAGWFAIGSPDRELVSVPPVTYEIWSCAPAYPTLWEACASLVAPAGSDPVRVVEAVLRDLHHLLSCTGAYVDPAVDR